MLFLVLFNELSRYSSFELPYGCLTRVRGPLNNDGRHRMNGISSNSGFGNVLAIAGDESLTLQGHLNDTGWEDCDLFDRNPAADQRRIVLSSVILSTSLLHQELSLLAHL